MSSRRVLEIDGSSGEGGGQILRVSLALACILLKPIRIVNIRAGRPKPGLAAQHLACVQAAAHLAAAHVEGAVIGSTNVLIAPTAPALPGHYTFSVGTAGAATLVLQAILPIAMAATRGKPDAGDFVLAVEGGTHAMHSPPADFFQHTLLPALALMGCPITAVVERVGLHPVGGGRIVVTVPAGWTPRALPRELAEPWHPLTTTTAAGAAGAAATAAAAGDAVPDIEVVVYGGAKVADLVAALAKGMPGVLARATVRVGAAARGKAAPVLMAHLPTVIDGGQDVVAYLAEGKDTEARMSTELEARVRARLQSGAPVGEELADQVLLPLALAAGGSFLSVPASSHTQTAVSVLRIITGRPDIAVWTETDGAASITVTPLLSAA